MTQISVPPPNGPALPSVPVTRPGRPIGHALLAAVLVIAGSALVGVAGGLVWAAVSPRVVYQVYTLRPPTAYAINPETSAFIAADGWYCFIALAGGALIGLLAYLLAIRRYGALPMAGAVAGALAAAFIVAWLGHEQSGGPGFDHLLATSKQGSYLHAPITLGSQGAIAFWPLAAAVVAGGIELVVALRERRRTQYRAVPMPGMESFGTRPYPWSPGADPGSEPGSQNGAPHPGITGYPGTPDPGARNNEPGEPRR